MFANPSEALKMARKLPFEDEMTMDRFWALPGEMQYDILSKYLPMLKDSYYEEDDALFFNVKEDINKVFKANRRICRYLKNPSNPYL